jgi:hypothetical protein
MSQVSGAEDRLRPVDGAWGRATLLFNLGLFAVPAMVAWSSTLTASAVLPMVGLGASLVGGLLMLLLPGWRRVGARVAAAAVLAAGLEVVLTLLLILAYSQANPGWDLS